VIRLLVAGAIALSASTALVAAPAAAAPAAAAPAQAAAARPDPGVDRRVADPRIGESSGLAVSPSHPDVLWTHDDSGNPPRLFALGSSGRVSATVRVTGVPDVDWEALAAFRDATGRALLAVGDIGDNLGNRQLVEVDVVAEPSPLLDSEVRPLLRLRLRYPDGPRDAETLLVDRGRGRMFVVSKGVLGSTVYVVPASAWSGRAPASPTIRSATLIRVGWTPLVLVTDGTVAPGGAVVLRTYGQLAVLDPPPLEEGRRVLVAQATADLPTEPQGEGVALSPDGWSVLLSSEGVGQPVLRFPLPDDVRIAVTGASSVSTPTSPTATGRASTGAASTHASGSSPRRSPTASATEGSTASSSSGPLGLVAGIAAIGVAAILSGVGAIGRRGRRSS
jgi:hypothetical protein